ncbi:MAG: MiaB/RimO family radical SAM methylthiotransferase [Planctomycetota bacterium]|nr:MiaB/RimO family radical SAM methylthiotransferase [Planctomycetota bacterium]
MRTLRYRITTLGCRVNHAEAREMESLLLDRGLVKAAARGLCDLEVIHTCSVTNTAAAKSRQAVRRALRRRFDSGLPRADLPGPVPGRGAFLPTIIVTGCYGSTNPNEAAQLAGGPHHVIHHYDHDGSAMTDRFARRLDEWLAGKRTHQRLRSGRPTSCHETILPLPLVEPHRNAGAHVRAELKIQDGCDAHCTFCIIPKVRRTLRSKTIRDAVDEARRLVDLGHREIVLTGIFIGAYGHETGLRRKQAEPGSGPLADLVDAVAGVRGLVRLRISSMEPGDVSEPLLDAMVANQPVVAPHLHLPLQSGSDAILKRMNRQYRVGDYLEMIDQATAALTTPDRLPPAITTDIICGFPGETDQDFEKTLEVVRRVGYLHMHVFPYSAKRGTAAARWTDRFIPPAVVKARVRCLIDLENGPDAGLSIRYRRRLLGRTVRVILEQPGRDEPAIMTGRCDHYALIHLRTRRSRGTLMHARIAKVTPKRTIGETIPAGIGLPVLR